LSILCCDEVFRRSITHCRAFQWAEEFSDYSARYMSIFFPIIGKNIVIAIYCEIAITISLCVLGIHTLFYAYEKSHCSFSVVSSSLHKLAVSSELLVTGHAVEILVKAMGSRLAGQSTYNHWGKQTYFGPAQG